MNAAAIHVPVRADGARARERLLDTALRLFADKGYDKTSTREIAEAAGVNLGAIAYYFGDKPSLYRAAFCCFLDEGEGGELPPQDFAACLGAQQAALPELLLDFYRAFLKPLKQGETARQVMRLHFRELVEPSGALHHSISEDLRPQHDMLTAALTRHLGAAADDVDVARLALALQGIAVHHFVGQDFVALVAPQLTATEEAIDVLADRLQRYALGMVEAEARRRAAPEGRP